MHRALYATALAGALGMVSVTALATTEGEFDNPTYEGVPCIALDDFEVAESKDADGRTVYVARTVVENVCPRSMTVSLCFSHPSADGVEDSCYGGTVRPFDRTEVVDRHTGARMVGPTYQWRYFSGSM